MTILDDLAARLGDELAVPLAIAETGRVLRPSLRFEPAREAFLLQVPRGASSTSVVRFVHRHRAQMAKVHAAWAAKRAASPLPERVLFIDGALIPVFGVPCRIHQTEGVRRGRRDGDRLIVGPVETRGRIERLLRAEALLWFETRSRQIAGNVGRDVQSVRIMNNKTRLGVCKSGGHLAFHWRLTFAPPELALYVVAHEVAHLVEMNHSPRFWQICDSLSPIPAKHARAWFRANAALLYRYGSPFK